MDFHCEATEIATRQPYVANSLTLAMSAPAAFRQDCDEFAAEQLANIEAVNGCLDTDTYNKICKNIRDNWCS